MSVMTTSIEQLSINTIRTLSMDAVQKANSGHPGTPMALAPVTYALWNEYLRYDPAEPNWFARDRFVLSCGHASMLLYSTLHLANVRAVDEDRQVMDAPAISLDNIRQFRQLGSPCAGHPEWGDAAGIEMTSGPLGQGVASSVGMAAGSRWLSARYDQPELDICKFNVYALCSDGDLMEGVGCEAASLAGHLKLSNLCWIYDDNHITIEGDTDLAFSEDVGQRFEALGWNVLRVKDANDLAAIRQAFDSFQSNADAPTLIIVRSVIAFGSPNKANTAGAHGAALGEEEVRLTKAAYGWPEDSQFEVPEKVIEHFAEGIGKRGRQLREAWESTFAEYRKKHAEKSTELDNIHLRRLPSGWDADLPIFDADEKGLASRASSGKSLNALAARIPWMLGGSADLAPSNNTDLKDDDAGHFGANTYRGRIFHFGIREHAMAAMGNGMSLVGLRPYVATFFVFSDYLRPAMRLSAVMHQPVLYIYTHDSIGLGEDGPTHQPVEHLAACRSIPGLIVARPADANEVTEIYRTVLAIQDRPAAMILSRQGLPTLDRSAMTSATEAARGAYVLLDSQEGDPEIILIGTGSEVSLCVAAQQELSSRGHRVRVVSMPSWELFEEQDPAYREQVLPSNVKARVGVEAAVGLGWERYLGNHGRFVGMSGFGASAPAKHLFTHFQITPDRIVREAIDLLSKE